MATPSEPGGAQAPAFTVFTPTWNRASTLGRVYASLCLQTFTDFEWLIVDDGSTDGTEGLVRGWQTRAPFPVRYHWQPNQGKHVAFNQGVALAHGQRFLTLDSDDACLPRALERLDAHWRAIPEAERESFAGVTGLCLDDQGRVVGQPFPADVLDSNPSELLLRFKVGGEKWGFTRTELLRRHPYPTPPGGRFVPESVVWIPIGARWRTRYVNQPLRVYLSAPDQLTHAGLRADHLPGLHLWHQVILNHEAGYLCDAPGALLRSAVNHARFGLGAGLGCGRIMAGLKPGLPWTLGALGLLPGWLLARRDAKRLGQAA